jgi:hypothetical protein
MTICPSLSVVFLCYYLSKSSLEGVDRKNQTKIISSLIRLKKEIKNCRKHIYSLPFFLSIIAFNLDHWQQKGRTKKKLTFSLSIIQNWCVCIPSQQQRIIKHHHRHELLILFPSFLNVCM